MCSNWMSMLNSPRSGAQNSSADSGDAFEASPTVKVPGWRANVRAFISCKNSCRRGPSA